MLTDKFMMKFMSMLPSCKVKCIKRAWYARTVMNPIAARFIPRAMPFATGAIWPPNTGPGNIIFTTLPMHRDPGGSRVLALALDREAPVEEAAADENAKEEE